MDNIITIIPARGGSKGVLAKNIRKCCGKPLIAWTIEQAITSKYFDKIIVSTDDNQISEISKQYGAEVPFLRPKKLAEDDSPTIDAIIHSLDFLENNGYHPEIVVLLQPTSPLRTAQDIESALNLFFEYEKICSAVVSVSEFDHSPYLSLKIEKGYLKPNFGEEYFNKRRQDLPQLYKPNGSIYISTPNNIRKYGGFFGNKIVPYKMPQERSVDIDTITDFKLAELMLGELNEIY